MTLAIGAGGGALFAFEHLPLSWLLGAMAATAAAAALRVPVHLPFGLRAAVMVILGVMLGGTFSPELVSRAAQWTVTMGSLVVYVVLVSATIYFGLMRWAGFSRPTAFFSSAPGGFGEMVMMGAALGGDVRAISLVHSVRIVMTVVLIAFWFRWFQGYVPTSLARSASFAGIGLEDGLILAGCGLLGYVLGQVTRIPAGPLLGPLAVSAAAHLAGLTAAQPPQALISLAQVVIGASAGCRFVGISLRDVAGAMAAGAASTLVMLIAAGAAAWGLGGVLGIPMPVVLLAFSPGGLAEMCLISLALGVDTAFVTAHHSLRLVFIVLCLPFAFRLAQGHRPPDRAVNDDQR